MSKRLNDAGADQGSTGGGQRFLLALAVPELFQAVHKPREPDDLLWRGTKERGGGRFSGVPVLLLYVSPLRVEPGG